MPSDDVRAAVFGSVAAAYDRLRPGYPDEAVDWLLPAGANRIAEVAAGTGKLTDALVARGLDVVVIEPDPAMLAVLRRRLPAVVAHRASAEALPLPDSCVDAVVVAQAWHWFDPVPAWAEVCRVLRPGGRLGLIGHVPTPTEPWEHALAALDPQGPEHAYPTREPAGLPGLPHLRTETATFPWVREITPVDLAELYGTYSIYAVMDVAERRARLAEITALADAEAQRRGTRSVPLTSVVVVDRVYPED